LKRVSFSRHKAMYYSMYNAYELNELWVPRHPLYRSKKKTIAKGAAGQISKQVL
jgi:hypothetical protein